MGRSQLGIAFFLVLCVVILSETITVRASSESFSLVESASVSRDVFANEGNRLVGNFTISNIPTWTDSSTGNPQTAEYAFKITKIEGPENCPHETELYGAYQEENASFDLYCNYTGIYRLRFNVGGGNPATGIGNMSTTLNYDVIKSPSDSMQVENSPASGGQSNEAPSPSTYEPNQSASSNVIIENVPNYPLILQVGSVLVVTVVAAMIALFYFRKRR